MHYLYKRKSNYQYTIFNDWGGTPFLLDYFDTEYDAISSLINKINSSDGRSHILHYIDNEFYKNSFVFTGSRGQKYYKILKRRVTDWIDLDSQDELVFENDFVTNNENNIIYFKNSVDNLKIY